MRISDWSSDVCSSDLAILRIDPKHPEPRQVDRTVSEIAAANGGRYDVDIHLRHDPSASASFAETHVRRLEAIRRVTGGVEREPDGTWVIAPDHLERARSEEHTSEPQSLIRTSYVVFCLKKRNRKFNEQDRDRLESTA